MRGGPPRSCAASISCSGDGSARGLPAATAHAAEALGFPGAIKLASPDIVHKSDVGGVVLHVIDGDGVREACRSIRESVATRAPAAHVTGFTIEDPKECDDIVSEAMRVNGPVVVQGVVDPYEPPMPGKIEPKQARKLAEALARGEPSREKIITTVGEDLIRGARSPSPQVTIGRAHRAGELRRVG